MDNQPPKKKSGIVAAVFSILQLGSGQLYAGYPLRGLVLFGASWVFYLLLFYSPLGRSFWSVALLLAAALALAVGGAIDAVRLARRPRTTDPRYQRWYAVLALVVGLMIGSALLLPDRPLRAFYMPSGSMAPTLRVGERLVATNERPGAAALRRGELVLFESPENAHILMLKRVVALPGDTLAIRDKQVYVNGMAVAEAWAIHRDPAMGKSNGPVDAKRTRDQLTPVVIPAGRVFVLGDDRDFSYDSRYFGSVPVASLCGRPLFIYWASDRSRIGTKLDRS